MTNKDYLVRGLSCVGKGEVSAVIAGETNASIISSDLVREKVPFLNIFRRGNDFMNDPNTEALKGIAYDIMFYAGKHRSKDPDKIIQALLNGTKHSLTKSQLKEIAGFYESQSQNPSQTLIYEATFPLPQLLRFYDEFKPFIIEVTAPPQKVIEMSAYRSRQKDNYSQAGLNIYAATKQGWIPAWDEKRIGRKLPVIVIENKFFPDLTELHLEPKTQEALVQKARLNLTELVRSALLQLKQAVKT